MFEVEGKFKTDWESYQISVEELKALGSQIALTEHYFRTFDTGGAYVSKTRMWNLMARLLLTHGSPVKNGISLMKTGSRRPATNPMASHSLTLILKVCPEEKEKNNGNHI